MKIAIISSIYNPKSGSRAPIELAISLSKKHQITFYAYNNNEDRNTLTRMQKTGINTIKIKQSKIPIIGVFFEMIDLFLNLKRSDYDILSAHTTLSLLISSWATRIPLVSTYYGTQFNVMDERFIQNKYLTGIINYPLNLIIFFKGWLLTNLPIKVISISSYSTKEAYKLYKKKAQTIYLGNISDSLKHSSIQKESKNIINLLTVSRITPYKQFDLIIESVKKLKLPKYIINLTIAGSSPVGKYLKYLNQIKTPSTKILVNCSDQNLSTLYQNCDIYLSADKYLFFGMPILEAASFGKPIIALNYAAAPELIIHGKTGFIAKNLNEFGSYLEKLIKNSSLRLKMGKMGGKNTNNFSWEKTADKYIRVFQNILNKKSKSMILPILGIIILGSILRILFLDKHSFWFDEAISYFISNRPIWSLLKATAADNNPPFYYLLLKIWMNISEDAIFLRSLSAFFGVLSIPFFYSVAKSFTNLRVAILATFIFSISPLQVYFSTETRTYTLLVFETLISYWLILKFQRNFNNLYLLILTFIEIIALYSHYYFFFVFLSLNLFFFLKMNINSRIFKIWILSQVLTLVSLIPWFVLVLKAPNPNCWCFYTWVGLPTMFTAFAIGGVGIVTLKDYIINGPQVPLIIFALTSISFFILFIVGVIRSKSKFYLNILFFFPLFMLSIIGLFKSDFSPRSAILFSPLYFIIIAQGLNSLRKFKKFWSLVIFISLIIVLALQYFVSYYHNSPLEDGAGLISKNFQKNEVIIHSSPMTFYSYKYYHKSIYPEFLVIPSDTAYYTITEIGGFDKPIEKIIPEYKNVWFVNIPSWITLKQFQDIQDYLSKDYLLDNQVHYNNLDIYHYHQK